jgi:hypothetical protein
MTALYSMLAVESRQLSEVLGFGEEFNVRLILYSVGCPLGGNRLAADQQVANACGIELKKQLIYAPARIGPTAGAPTPSTRSFPRARKTVCF